MILMRVDARKYTLANYGSAICKVILGFLPFSIWFCVLFPFCVAGVSW